MKSVLTNVGLLSTLIMFVSTLSVASPKRHGAINVAFLDFSGNNVSEGQTENAKNRILLHIINESRITVLEPRKTREAIISQNSVPPDYREPGSAAKIGRYLLADYVIFGTLDRVAATKERTIYVRVINSFTGAVVYADSESYENPSQILSAADNLSVRIIKVLSTFKPARYSTGPISFMLLVSGLYLQPLDEFNSVASSGGSVSILFGIYIHDFSLGIRTGCSIMDGIGNNRFALIVPMQLSIGYNFSLPSRFFIMLNTAGGFSYNYLARHNSFSDGFSPLVSLSLSPGYSLSDALSCVFIIESGCLIEQKKGLWFLQAGIGIEYIY